MNGIPSPYSEFVVPELGVVRWWSVFVTLGILGVAWVAARHARRLGLDTRHVIPLLLTLLPVGVIGARVYYVIFEWDQRFSQSPEQAWQIWQGGLALHGALLAGLAALWIYARVAHIGFRRWADAIALGVPLGLAIGRWGDYFNQQSFGAPTDLPWAIQIDAAFRPAAHLTNALFHPTFFYASMWNLLLFGLLLTIARRTSWTKPGDLALLFVLLYSVGRFLIESLRIDAILIGDDLRLAMIVSALLAALALAILLWRHGLRSFPAGWRAAGRNISGPLSRVRGLRVRGSR